MFDGKHFYDVNNIAYARAILTRIKILGYDEKLDEKTFMEYMDDLDKRGLLMKFGNLDNKIDKYLTLYEALKKNGNRLKPKIAKVAERIINENPFLATDHDTLLLDIQSHDVGDMKYTANSSINIAIPAYRILNDKFAAAFYIINIVIQVDVDSLEKLLFKILFDVRRPDIIDNICNLHNMHLSVNLKSYLEETKWKISTYDEDTKTYSMRFTIADDLDEQEVKAIRDTKIEELNRLCMEFKYCLGL